MDPAGLSLLALSASSVALRRYNELSKGEIPAFPGHRIDGRPREGIIVRLKRARPRVRSLIDAGRERVARKLHRFAAASGMRLHTQVALSAVICVEGDPEVAAALRWRKVDFLIADETGLPLCGIAVVQGTGPAYRDSVCHAAFRAAGLPMVTLSTCAEWDDIRAKLVAALKLDAPAANQFALPPPARAGSNTGPRPA